jgi:RNA polymerase sigma-70 factor (ECF subfamily)
MSSEPARLANERDLIEALRAGDDAAFERLVRDATPRLLSTARRILRNHEEAKDAVQETFIQAYRALPGFQGASLLSTWLHRIAVNTCLMRLRSRRRRPEEALPDEGMEALLPRFDATGHALVKPQDWAASAEELLATRETREWVRAAIDSLPDTHRAVLLLRDIEELDTKEAAGLLDISENACKVRLHRARQALRTRLAARFGEGAL